VAAREHLTYMVALLSRNVSMVELACRAHLASAKETLKRSTSAQPQTSVPVELRQHVATREEAR
jgi:DNA-binding GntR family transcriptional regulator